MADQTSIRLIIFSHFFAPGIGGVEKQVMSLASGLIQKNGPSDQPKFEVTVVTNTAAPPAQDALHAFQVIRRPNFFRLFRLIQRADVVHIAGPSLLPLAISYFLRKPTVIEHHGYQSICPNGILIYEPDRSVCPGHFQARRYAKCLKCLAAESSLASSFKQLLLMFPRYLLSKSVTANIAITKHVLQRHGLPHAQVIYYGIENVADLGISARPPRRDGDKFRFAFVGRFVPEKGIEVLLLAARMLKSLRLDFEVRLIGDGPLRAELEETIKRLDLVDHVYITGFVDPGLPMKNALSDVDVVVVPSVWEEAAGFSAIEQMIDGRLVIASDVGGLAEIVADGGLLFPMRDAAALASLMKRVLLDRSLVESIGATSRKRALALFDRDRMIRDHVRLYLKVARLPTVVSDRNTMHAA